ncbi:unnamed protein product [Vitrella brassicaformis CCMP3155]|uniref:BSD domain-containing protein n=1 Tax=Vitrella brassicaformis (strain CCMP3155) TaxID=1169540 RepID=A0A0G4H5D0_VITBC|nr:unnamed protein product [Vitrella brassicaformis CCMP3155]|eukprot:CEM38995.1 unnamed protein product [Vitrella brassicaformis CCMP3155]
MGSAESTSAEEEQVEMELKDMEQGVLQDDNFPWFHIVQWCSEEVSSDTVFRWSLDEVRERVLRLTDSVESFLEQCPPADLPDFTLDDTTTFVEWAGALLEQLPSLKEVRYRLVPSRIKEERFWKRYFGAIKNILTQELLATPTAEKTHAPPTPLPFPIKASLQNGLPPRPSSIAPDAAQPHTHSMNGTAQPNGVPHQTDAPSPPYHPQPMMAAAPHHAAPTMPYYAPPKMASGVDPRQGLLSAATAAAMWGGMGGGGGGGGGHQQHPHHHQYHQQRQQEQHGGMNGHVGNGI